MKTLLIMIFAAVCISASELEIVNKYKELINPMYAEYSTRPMGDPEKSEFVGVCSNIISNCEHDVIVALIGLTANEKGGKGDFAARLLWNLSKRYSTDRFVNMHAQIAMALMTTKEQYAKKRLLRSLLTERIVGNELVGKAAASYLRNREDSGLVVLTYSADGLPIRVNIEMCDMAAYVVQEAMGWDVKLGVREKATVDQIDTLDKRIRVYKWKE